MKKIILVLSLLLLCSSCVSRTTYEGGVQNDSQETIDSKELIWFWDDNF